MVSFFSTYHNILTTDPKQMVIPIDDHGFHRGDGVFEAVKWFGNKVWLLEPHLSRLQKSCERIGLALPLSISELKLKLEELRLATKQDKGLFRIFVTRGPGSFGVSPYESTAPQIYIVATELSAWSDERVRKGVTIMRSSLQAKKGLFAQVKSLNYLPNVLMKKEAVDAGFDFAIGVDDTGDILESSTENLGIIKGDSLITPPFDSTLRGTSLIRLTELILNEKNLTGPPLTWQSRSFSFDELVAADEVFLVGTTIDVLPVSKIEDHIKIKNSVSLRMRALLQQDQK